jgi:methylthioribose-1-phosphate isomerase
MTAPAPSRLPPTIEWRGGTDGRLRLLDQTRLPETVAVLELSDLEGVADAIVRLSVRGAPAIGVAAAYGVLLGVRARAPRDRAAFLRAADAAAHHLLATRPTAVNLRCAVERMLGRARAEPDLGALLDEAVRIHTEDRESCRRIGEHGACLVPEGARVLTHCNAGRLATAGEGTALSVLFTAARQGRQFSVLCCETRPLLQGARLTALELHAEGIPARLLVDGAAAGLIARGEVDLVLTGADRIAANGDVANKVGTYGLALAARAHGVPMYVAAPASTFDLSLPAGAEIPIEERDPGEVLSCLGRRLGPAGVTARNPAFDLTPAHCLTALVTDLGLIRPVTAAAIKAALGAGR